MLSDIEIAQAAAAAGAGVAWVNLLLGVGETL